MPHSCARQFLRIVHFIQLAPRKQRDIDIIVDVWTLLHAVCGTFLFYDDELLDMNYWRINPFRDFAYTLDYYVPLARRPKYDHSSVVRRVRNGVMIYWVYVLGAFLGDDLAISTSQSIILLARDTSMTQQVLDAIINRSISLGFAEV